MELRLHSPVGAEAISYQWPSEPVAQHTRALEIMETLRWVCEDLPDLRPALENNILRGVRTTDRSSVAEMCRRYNRAVDGVVSLERGTSLPARRIQRLPSTGLLKHILQQCYNRAVTEPQKLNLYEAFSESVYGETSFEVICQMVEELKVSDQDVFIDLGSGIGQIVLQMAASSACKVCYGIEKCDIPNTYAEHMSEIFQKWLRWFGKKSGKYELLKGDFLSENFQDKINSATIIFANNFAFGPTLDHQLKQRFAELRDGTRIVSSKNFCSLNFRMTERNMSDIGAIMNVLNNKITGAVSWTDKPIPYYIQIIDRSKLARYFESKKSPKYTAKYCSDSSGESDSDTSSDFECSPFRVKGKKSNNATNPTDALHVRNLERNTQIDAHPPFLHSTSHAISPKVSNEQSLRNHASIHCASPSSDIISPKNINEQFPITIDTRIQSRLLLDESTKLIDKSSLINPSNTYNQSTYFPSRSPSPDSKLEDFAPNTERECNRDRQFLSHNDNYDPQGNLHIRSQSSISYKSSTKSKSSHPKDYRSRSPFTANRSKIKHSKKSIARQKSFEHDSPFRSPKCKSRKLDKIHENDDRSKSPKHKSKTAKRNINKNHVNYSSISHNESDYKISQEPKPENEHSNYNLRHVNVKYASESEGHSEFDDEVPRVKCKTSKRDAHLKKSTKSWSKKNHVDKKKYLNDFENFFQNVTSPKSIHDNKVHLRRNANYDLELVDNGDNINRIRLKRFYKNMQSPVSDSESDREVQLNKSPTYESTIDNEFIDTNDADSISETVTENLYKKSPKYYTESVIKNPNTIELSESEKLLIKITSPNNARNEYAPFIETKFNISRTDLSECESPKSASEVLSPLYTSKLMIQGNMNKIRLIKKRRHPAVAEKTKTENKEDPFETSPSKHNSKCVENINFDQPNKYDNSPVETQEMKVSSTLEITNISKQKCDGKSVDDCKIGARRRKSKPKKKVRSPSPFDNLDSNKSFANVLIENKIPDKEVALDPKTEFLSDNSIDYVQKPVFFSDNSNLESLHSHCEDSNSNFEATLKPQESKREPGQDCTHENLENRIPNLGNQDEMNTCCRVTRRTNKVCVKEIVKSDKHSPEKILDKCCRKPKKIGVRKTKRKKVYNIKGLDLLHEKTMHSISLEEIKKYERPPFGCIEEKLPIEKRVIGLDEIDTSYISRQLHERDFEKLTVKQYFEKENSLEMSSNILSQLSENFETSQNSIKTNIQSRIVEDSEHSISGQVNMGQENKYKKQIVAEKSSNYIKDVTDYSSRNADCEILNNGVDYNVRNRNDVDSIDNYDCHNCQFDPESKLTKNKTENTAKFDDRVKSEPSHHDENKPKHTQGNSTKYSKVNGSYVTSELSDLNVTSQSDLLQRLLSAYRQQFLQMVDQMRSPEYKRQIESQISTEKNRNTLLSKKASQLKHEIQGLLSNGTSLLRCHLRNLNIKPTPKDVLIAGKQIVHRNINLRDQASQLQADLLGLETEKDRLVEKRSEDILKCNEVDLNENLVYVQVILAQAKEMILRNRDLKKKCCKLEEQLDTLEKHQGYILTEQARETMQL